MDSSALESALKSLANAISTSENAISSLARTSAGLTWWLDFWTIMVVIGVVIEVVVIVKEFIHKRKAYLPNIIRSMEKPLFRELFWELIGAVLVAIGVACEVWVGIDIADIQSQLARENQNLVGYFNQTATLRSGAAIERASNADERSRKLEKENFVLQTDLLRLQRESEPRFLTSGQYLALAEVGRRFSPSRESRIMLESYVGQDEPKTLVGQITSALKPIPIFPKQLSMSLDVTGISILGPERDRGLIDAIALALSGLSVTTTIRDDVVTTIRVGGKPTSLNTPRR